jgi:hypothetical protein
MNDPTDPETIPSEVRARALEAAQEAVRDVLEAAGYFLDYLARLELLDDALDEAAAGLEAS